jgi:hypothetical protein
MSLQGTLRTLGITEVLEFLDARSATGRLDINADSGGATYWMLRGEVAEVVYDFEREGGEDAAEATYYALSELDGTFFFDEGEAPEHGTPTEAVVDVLGRTADIAEGWSIVEEFVPSQRHELTRSDALDGSVTIEPAWWGAIEAIGSGCNARELADKLNMRTLAASTMAADMARNGLISVGQPRIEEAHDMSAEVAAEPLEAHVQDTFETTPAFETEAPIDLGLASPAPDVVEVPIVEAPVAQVAPEPEISQVAVPEIAAEPAPFAEAPAIEPVAAEPPAAVAPAAAPVAEPVAAASWDTPVAAAVVPTEAPASWPVEAPAPEPVAAAQPAPESSWDTSTPAEPSQWDQVPETAPNPWPAEPEPAPVAEPVVTPVAEDDGWASDHSQPAAAYQFPEANDAASALASWGAAAAQAPAAQAVAHAAEAAPTAPAAAPVVAANDPFADLPTESELAQAAVAPPAPVEPAPMPVAETTAPPVAPAPLAEAPSYESPPTQAAVFASAPPAPSPYAPDAGPVPAAAIAPPAGTVEALAGLDDLDDADDDEDFGTDDRSSVLKFLRRD